MIGKTLGHYRVLEKLGSGGMGEVYRAHDEHLQRDVAIKVLPPGTLSDQSARKRFRKEALALSKLNHPNIETVFDFDTEDGTDFLVMEYVPGHTLKDKLASGRLPEEQVIMLGTQIAAALEEAHGRGVVHRDLKPANIMLMPKGRLKVLDFGLAKLLRPAIETATTESVTEAPSQDTDPAWFPDGSGIAFTRKLNGRMAIWKVGPLGGGATLLLDDAKQPDISPDASKIAFVRASWNGACRIGIGLLRDPSAVKMLTDDAVDADAGHPAWSPDGHRIGYVDRRELWIVDASGGPPRCITSDGEDKSGPAWSPDGSHIYFSSYQGGPQSLWRIAADGGVPERLTYGTGPEDHPSVSRDGRILAYATHDVQRRLVLLDRDSGEQKLLPGLQCWMPSIAPVGSRADQFHTDSGPGPLSGRLDQISDKERHSPHSRIPLLHSISRLDRKGH